MSSDLNIYLSGMPESSPSEQTAYFFLKSLHKLPFHVVENTRWESIWRIKHKFSSVPDSFLVRLIKAATESDKPTLHEKYAEPGQNETQTRSGVRPTVHTTEFGGGATPPPILKDSIDEEADCCTCPSHRTSI